MSIPMLIIRLGRLTAAAAGSTNNNSQKPFATSLGGVPVAKVSRRFPPKCAHKSVAYVYLYTKYCPRQISHFLAKGLRSPWGEPDFCEVVGCRVVNSC